MAETKWTPGPWEPDGSRECMDIRDARGSRVAWVTYMPLNGPRRTQEEVTANAHLIASAPELYRALEALQRRIVEADLWHGQEDELDAATAALAKARGEK